MKRWLMVLILEWLAVGARAQALSMAQVAQAPQHSSLRGLSVAGNGAVWVSGSKGTVGRRLPGDTAWQWNTISGFEQRDFRDIHAFDSQRAVAMAVDNPAIIVKTTDGGHTWKTTFEQRREGMFLDAMDFKNDREGICIGDPLAIGAAGKKLFFIIRTSDGGDSWTPGPLYQLPPAADGEALFSASGTNIAFLQHPDFEYAFVTGGTISNLFMMGRPGKPNKMVNIPINQGIASTGTFSMATDGQQRFYCIGGDYKEPNNQYDNFYYTTDAGKKWASAAVAPPFGYRSCIGIVGSKRLVACGTNGVDLSADGGKTWKKISNEGFNVCMPSADGTQVYLAGGNGKVALLQLATEKKQ